MRELREDLRGQAVLPGRVLKQVVLQVRAFWGLMNVTGKQAAPMQWGPKTRETDSARQREVFILMKGGCPTL